jgi:hypothetical protein
MLTASFTEGIACPLSVKSSYEEARQSMNAENGAGLEARTTEWIAICITFAIIIYKIAVPGQSALLPITSWEETIGNRPLLLGFSAVCALFITLGASIGYHGLSWHFTNAYPTYRILMLTMTTVQVYIVLWMQQKHHFIAGDEHFGITSACLILGILIGSALELHTHGSNSRRFGSTIMHISVAVITGIWSAVAAENVELLKFKIRIHPHFVWSVSVIGVLVGWLVSIVLEHHVKSSTRVILPGIALMHLVVLLILPVNSVFPLLHEVSLDIFGTPMAVVAVLTGIHAGVTMNPTATKV